MRFSSALFTSWASFGRPSTERGILVMLKSVILQHHEREVLRSVRGRSAQADAGAKLREALDMLRMTLDLMRGNIRRDYPKASEAEIERRLEEWKKADVSAHEVPGYIVRSEKHLRRYLSAQP